MTEHAIDRPRAPGFGARLAAARYAAAQGARVAWYAAHYALSRRMSGPITQPGEIPYAPESPKPDAAKVRRAFMKLFADDRAAITQGLYPAPRDLDPRKLGRALAQSRRYFAGLSDVDARRARRDGTEARRDAPPGRYPSYYLQNFHYQTGGWLSRESAEVYDTQVEVLFTGAADAMRRAALAAIAREIRGRDQRGVTLLDLACGSGRFLEQTLDAFPRLRATGLDLSPAYLETAATRLKAWPQAELVEANAEAAPFDAGVFDVVASIYLFHELPPRVRPIVAGEAARLVKPGGLVVLADSLQFGDDANLDQMLEWFPKLFHEPYYAHYARDDLDAHFIEAGLALEETRIAFLTKVKTFRKPL